MDRTDQHIVDSFSSLLLSLLSLSTPLDTNPYALFLLTIHRSIPPSVYHSQKLPEINKTNLKASGNAKSGWY